MVDEDKKADLLTGYQIDLDEIVKKYVEGMIFNGDERKKPNPDDFFYYLDPVAKKVLLYMELCPVQNGDEPKTET